MRARVCVRDRDRNRDGEMEKEGESGRGAFREWETYQAAIRSLGQLCLHSESGIDDEPVPRRSLRDRGRERDGHRVSNWRRGGVED